MTNKFEYRKVQGLLLSGNEEEMCQYMGLEYIDAFDGYTWFWYHRGLYEISEGKRGTLSVVGDNSELRHYFARLARSSRCFSRCPKA